MTNETTRSLFDQLSKVIELPKRCRSLVLRMSVDELPTLEVEYFAEGNPEAEPVTERFELKQITDG